MPPGGSNRVYRRTVRLLLTAALLATSCTFGGGGVGTGETETGSSGGEPSGTADRTGANGGEDTSRASGGGEGTTEGPDASGAVGNSDDPMDDAGPNQEVCNGVDDDGDGAVDEFSASNASCGPCSYAVGPHTQFVYSFCSEPAPAILADLNCELLGARLASIPDAETDHFVFSKVASRRSFIGYTDEAQEDTWLWVDGAPSEYDNWNFAEPNNAGGDQNCAVVRDNDGQWDDVRCDVPHPYICRAPL